MRRIEWYEIVKLKDGREGTVIEIYETDGRQDGFLVDVGSTHKVGDKILWDDPIEVDREDIAD